MIEFRYFFQERKAEKLPIKIVSKEITGEGYEKVLRLYTTPHIFPDNFFEYVIVDDDLVLGDVFFLREGNKYVLECSIDNVFMKEETIGV